MPLARVVPWLSSIDGRVGGVGRWCIDVSEALPNRWRDRPPCRAWIDEPSPVERETSTLSGGTDRNRESPQLPSKGAAVDAVEQEAADRLEDQRVYAASPLPKAVATLAT